MVSCGLRLVAGLSASSNSSAAVRLVSREIAQVLATDLRSPLAVLSRQNASTWCHRFPQHCFHLNPTLVIKTCRSTVD
jgi:hypothetical protein